MNKFNLKKIKSTVASISWQLFETDYLKFTIDKIPIDTLEYFKKYYYGGRVDVLCEKNKFYYNIYSYDVNSLYPFCMLNKFPNPYNYSEVKGKINRFDDIYYFITECEIKVRIELITDRNKFNDVGFTCNSKQAFITSNLYNYLKNNGLIIKIKRIKTIYFFDTINPFNKFVDFFYNEKLKSKNKIDRYFNKIILNSLYGKFGTGNKSFELTKYSYEKEIQASMTNHAYEVRTFNDIKLLEIDNSGKYPYYTNFILSIFITDYARLENFKMQYIIEKDYGKLLYTDTDSFYIQFKNKNKRLLFEKTFIDNKKIGYLKKE